VSERRDFMVTEGISVIGLCCKDLKKSERDETRKEVTHVDDGGREENSS